MKQYILPALAGGIFFYGLSACAPTTETAAHKEIQEINAQAEAALAEAPPISHVKILQRTPSFEEVELADGTRCVIRVGTYSQYNGNSLFCNFK